ncbi:hypothetical protein GCM10009804_14840 [Kribbella hippodromi]|uniref:Uncharacterized protein n=1 Tax=Kribbella hippodromi TaxID=434347 RepID=A0ABN2CIG3_9ACTN
MSSVVLTFVPAAIKRFASETSFFQAAAISWRSRADCTEVLLAVDGCVVGAEPGPALGPLVGSVVAPVVGAEVGAVGLGVLLVSVEHAVVTAISRTATTAIGRRFIGAAGSWR